MSEIQEGQTATNPKTGQRIIFKGGQWHNYTEPGAAPSQPTKSGQPFETSKSRDAARAALDQMDRIQPQVDRVRALYNETLRGSGPLKSLGEFMPTQANARFDNAVAGLRTLVRPAQRTPGEGAMSDFESKLAIQNLPNRYSFDSANEEALDGLQTFLDTSRASYSKRLGLPTPPPSVRRKPSTNGWTIRKVK
ncbi:hypothetical protein H5V43_16305 [Sphingobium fuliginis]|jgi:hypothetical protein|uniref:Uncharacterized protein n=1 Tax=Sphingobium fuliginis (strain ATCC 27551) TaxID=336203 RepID=A0A7M2GG88_SPHSA|nr:MULTISPECIES: hypothetical protein [Sphingobium]PNQ03642.1 hypothetical protein A8G00_10445 [Sphingobium sp. SA916]QOT71603.1 hypothetical protein H5V43_16305 [Sphingobium fuliginis]